MTNEEIKSISRRDMNALVKRIQKEYFEKMRSVAESGKDLQNNYTPEEICNMLLDKVELDGNKSILVLYNIEIVFQLWKRRFDGKLTFFTSSKDKVEFAKKLFPDVCVQYIPLEENPIYYLEMKKWPEKFDIIVSNPPYSKYLHVKFLEKSLNIAKEKIVFVHPANQFINTKGGNSTYVNSNKLIEDKLESVTLFNGNGVFGIGLYAPCSITELNPNGNNGKIHVKNLMQDETYISSSISDITQFKNKSELWSLKSKIDSYVLLNGSLDSILGKKSNGDFMVEFTRITAGNVRGTSVKISDKIHNKDFFIFISKYQLLVKEGKEPKYDLWFRFKTEQEANNFLNYLKTDFARFSLAMYKYAQSLNNGELRFVPLMDFTQEWNDEKLYAHFGITKEEQEYIKEIIPPYYD